MDVMRIPCVKHSGQCLMPSETYINVSGFIISGQPEGRVGPSGPYVRRSDRERCSRTGECLHQASGVTRHGVCWELHSVMAQSQNLKSGGSIY